MLSILILIAIAGLFLLKGGASKNTVTNVPENTLQGEIQKVVLGTKDYNYYPNSIRVKAGSPVEVTLDSSVRGCYRSFNIPQFGISVYSQNPSDTIKFISNNCRC